MQTEELTPHNSTTGRRVEAVVVSHREVQPGYWRLTLHEPYIAAQAVAGQFVHVLPRAHTMTDPLLRRAFSVLRTEDESFEILYRAGGKGTLNMTQWREGEAVDVLGPLGRPFANAQHLILVGGGVGVPPMAMVARQQFLAKQGGGVDKVAQTVEAIIGARRQQDVLCVEDFEQHGVSPHIVTEDGSLGVQGLVTGPLEELLKQLADDDNGARGGSSPLKLRAQTLVLSCGPLPMLRTVAALCAQYSVPCQVSLEENMPCGVGVCNGCVVPVQGGTDDYSNYRRICVEGAVMWADDIAWT